MNSTQHPSFELPQQSPTPKRISTAGIVALLVIVLVAVAGIATFWELRSSTENRSRASLGLASVGLNAAQTELKPNTATNAYVTLTPNGKAVSAVDIPIKYDPAFVTISDFTIASDKLPTPLLSTKIDPNAGTLRFVAGISKISGNQQIGLPITQNTQIASFKIATKNKTGNTTISIDGERLQVAAYDHEDNVGQVGSSIVLSIATQQAVCNQTCSTNDECANDANNLTCTSNRCRLKTNPTSENCQAQTACESTLLTPANNESIESAAAFTWESCAQAHSYQLMINKGEETIALVEELNLKNLMYAVNPNLSVGETYTWKVRACLNPECTSAGNWTDTRSFTVKTPPTVDPKTPLLEVSFLQQGVTKANVTLPVSLTIVYGENQKIHKSTQAVSESSGRFFTKQPVELEELQLREGATATATIYAKTPTSLVSKVGTIKLVGGAITGVLGGKDEELIIGDYKNDGADANVLKINDISLAINAYTKTSAPVTDETRIYDSNYDGIFDITDISLVLGNFRKLLEYRGDEI